MNLQYTPVRLGVVGAGAVTRHLHLPALATLQDVKVVAIADVDGDRAAETSRRFQIPRSYTEVRRLLEDDTLEAVAVCVPPRWHAEVGLAALEAGRHVFVEKPVTISLAECDRLVARAASAQKKVLMGFNLRWHGLVRRARAMIARGLVGRPEMVRSVFTAGLHMSDGGLGWRQSRTAGGGAFYDMGVHHFDLWRYVTGAEVEEVTAVSRSEASEDAIAGIAARMTGGILATAGFSSRTGEGNEIEVFGPAGTLRVSCYRFDGLEFTPAAAGPGSLRIRLDRLAMGVRELPAALARARTGGEILHMYREEWRHFAQAIRLGVPVECTLDDGRRALQVSLAAAASAAWRRPVRVADAPSEPPIPDP